jgi:comEA protein
LNLQHRAMTGEEKKALSFVAILIGLSVLARVANRPDPVVVAGAAAVQIPARLAENEEARLRNGAPASRAAPPPAAHGAPSIIDVNRATVAELDAVPGIGPAVAQRIVDYRTTVGRFTSLEQLDSVKGIGPALLQKIQPHIRF